MQLGAKALGSGPSTEKNNKGKGGEGEREAYIKIKLEFLFVWFWRQVLLCGPGGPQTRSPRGPPQCWGHSRAPALLRTLLSKTPLHRPPSRCGVHFCFLLARTRSAEHVSRLTFSKRTASLLSNTIRETVKRLKTKQQTGWGDLQYVHLKEGSIQDMRTL